MLFAKFEVKFAPHFMYSKCDSYYVSLLKDSASGGPIDQGVGMDNAVVLEDYRCDVAGTISLVIVTGIGVEAVKDFLLAT